MIYEFSLNKNYIPSSDLSETIDPNIAVAVTSRLTSQVCSQWSGNAGLRPTQLKLSWGRAKAQSMQ